MSNETRLLPTIDGVQIPGILLRPPQPLAGLLLIPGSLNSDVDGNYAPIFPGQPAIAPHAYKDLAGQLAARGIAVLRFAKTGPGTGSVVVDQEQAGQKYRTFPQRVRVAEAFLAELRRLVPEAPPFLAGHSEGAVVASLLAQTHPEIRGVVSLSGPAQPLLRMMLEQQFAADQHARRVTPDLERHHAAALRLLDDFVAARPLPQNLAGNPYASALAFAAAPENAPYLRSLEQVDPAAEFARVAQPGLIVQGGRDGSVSPANAALLQQAKPDATMELFPGLQHFYKPVTEGTPAQAAFAETSESDPAVAQAIACWIGALPLVPPIM